MENNLLSVASRLNGFYIDISFDLFLGMFVVAYFAWK